MRRTYLIKNALRNGFSHPIGFFRAEARTKTLIKALKGIYKVPAFITFINLFYLSYSSRYFNFFLLFLIIIAYFTLCELANFQ